ncbi:LAQU0S15e02828g1_1 [Lachancea quebecensis]|uniref:Pre-mRNA-splicing factor CWC25 n=1 Tax=Lachancea quebecensis TaxID=1654605 RepID=A0A0P1L2A8_9SACH|nr:LAQU0S15e02828g1_1 [Lachancea quebecensis]
MGTGDLNLLKSWNPHLLKNRKKVWETEQQLLEEQRKFKERQIEIDKERQLDDLTSLTRTGAKHQKKNGMDWMYNDPAATNEQNTDFLLGKKRIDAATLKKNDKPQPQKKNRHFDTSNKGIHSFLDNKRPIESADLSRDDPLAAFQKAQQLRMKTKQPDGFQKVQKTQHKVPKTDIKNKQTIPHALSRQTPHYEKNPRSKTFDMDY